ncbi:MAG: DUF3006 domain-containing protein [Gemmatimonadota bacterium]|nr:MAG: DUF3006 domain-containing protein [Gemmatimonadota bacterium]
MAAPHYLAVDKVHASDAVIVDDHGRAFTVPLSDLPAGLAERTVLKVIVADDGTPDWSSAEIDARETERRQQRSADLTERLRHSDDHGFLHPGEEP